MKLKKIISGGQTGADKEALIQAKNIGLETGGTAPKGYRTEIGVDPTLKDFGLVESPYYDYAPRTKQNVADGEATIWFGNLGSPGYWCTKNAAKAQDKPFFENPSHAQFKELVNAYEVINFAGNRNSKNPSVNSLVRDAFASLGA